MYHFKVTKIVCHYTEFFICYGLFNPCHGRVDLSVFCLESQNGNKALCKRENWNASQLVTTAPASSHERCSSLFGGVK